MPFDSEIGPVKLYSPSSPGRPWRVTWTPPGLQRQVKDRKTKAGAEKLAKEIKRQLKRGDIGQVHRATTDEQQLLEICRKLRDPKSILEEALKKQENFKRETVAACCDLYIAEYKDRGSAMTFSDSKDPTLPPSSDSCAGLPVAPVPIKRRPTISPPTPVCNSTLATSGAWSPP